MVQARILIWRVIRALTATRQRPKWKGEQPGFFTVDAGGIGRRWLGNNLSGCEKMRDIAKKL
jgi:hypothetical protein